MTLKYYISFAYDVGEDVIVEEIIEEIRYNLLDNRIYEWEFTTTEIPCLGKVNRFKTDQKEIAELVHEDLKTSFDDVDGYVFPIQTKEEL